ncbi:bifunctional transcriptional activator/DNA repair enzyme AdaA [Cohnella sp. AR92]|uniref:bifunctional transcriptional activator/DNA repair enzyme AdaA n=1 Tax=Cohnella sp. AR92 TaxID=648716 RepID=UPI000F8DCC81|nr:bifunctional transcriptional activator/DNA repair enzyme AdaA [Cohnella sp. AR92]RUS43299.1 methylphosphotriester-DNA--protein-cysteine methyltransferase family protein [Cohnella sp. AR92]
MADRGSPYTDRAFKRDESKTCPPEPVTDEQWLAIINNEASYDGQFYYAVKTTGIFCRPSCKSRPPNRENIGFYPTADQALAAKYRPCKRCKPTGQRLPNEEWIALAIDYIDRNYKEMLTLENLAAICHGTPYHLHRTFKKVMGITPVDYIQHIRIENAQTMLTSSTAPIAEVGARVGLSNTPYFITLFKKKTGQTPQSYRKRHYQQLEESVQNDE